MKLLDDIDYAFNEMEANGRPMPAFRSAWVKWVHFVLTYAHGWTGSENVTEILASEGRFDMLEAMVVVLDASPARVNIDQAIRFGTYLDGIVELLGKDEGLDDALRAHILKLVQQLRRALDEYEATGQFDAEEALTQMWVAFMAAEARSKGHRGAWKKFGAELRLPVTSGILVNLPTLALAAAQILSSK